ncbi:MAG: hypothetical protein ACREJ0_08830 [Geminicoccaceae bacterium]
MAPDLTAEERLRAARSLAPLLGQDMDSWSATAVPRALLALLPMLDAAQAHAILNALPSAIAKAAVATGSGSRRSPYLLTLMRLTETIAGSSDEIVADLGRALAEQVGLPNEPLQRAALAHASVPVLARLGDSAGVLQKTVVDVALLPVPVPEGTILDPVARSLLRRNSWRNATAAWEQALASLGDESKGIEPELALEILHTEWSTQPVRSNPYRRAAQARLLAMLAPTLSPPSATLASSDLLALLADIEDYVTREAIAQALTALAPALPDPDRRKALSAAKLALAETGFAEEAVAWAGAIAAMLPGEPREATAETVEALKYPTATGAPSEVLLEGLAKVWPEQYEAIADRTLPDPIVTDWLQERLPDGLELTDPVLLPDGLELIDPPLSGLGTADTVPAPQRPASRN